jgi:hypothetical protein
VRAVLATVVVPLVLVAAVSCGDSGGGSAPVSASASTTTTHRTSAPSVTTAPSATTPAATSDLVTVEVTVVAGRVDPPPARVEVPQGGTIRITVTSDEPDVLHVHGYDAELELTPGQPGTIDLVTSQTGLFEVETHEQGLQLFQLVVR